MGFHSLLVYPPASPGEALGPALHDPDALFVPYGLLTLAAELRSRGVPTDVLNLSALTWSQAADVVRRRPVELVGLSCYTFHRHAAAALGARIKEAFPQCHLTAGGPHVSALAPQWLEHYAAFDSVVIGEGEATTVELVERLRTGRAAAGLPGAAWRDGSQVALGPSRPPIAELDSLAKPWRHFDYGFLLTSRGCAGDCTFCASPQLWGRRVRLRSIGNVLEELEELVVRRGHNFLGIKDDTFSLPRARALELCEAIVARKIEFRWMCDSRVDCLDAELLRAMRRAGCVKIHLGVESADPEVLAAMNKRIDLEQVVEVTARARELGLDVRHYFIVGARGDTPSGVRRSLEFIERARPTHVLTHGLDVYPGTDDFHYACGQGLLSADDYFTHPVERFQSVNLGQRSPEMEDLRRRMRPELGAERDAVPYTLAERERIAAQHPELLGPAIDLACAYAAQWRLAEAEAVLRDACSRGGDASAEVWHCLACVAFARTDMATTIECFHRARQLAPQDTSLTQNGQLLAVAGRAGGLDYQRHGELAGQLLANLRSRKFLFLAGGPRDLTVPLSAEEA